MIIPGSGDNANWVGILLALGAGLSYALYALFNKELLEKYTPDLAIALIFSISAVLLAPLLFIYKPLWLAETSGLIAALHLGLIATALAYILFAGGLAHLPLPTAVTITLAEPLTATMLGLFLLDERLALTSFAGAALLFIGLLVLARK